MDLVAEINVLLENDYAVVVSNDVIAVQAVAILFKVVRTFGALVPLHAQDPSRILWASRLWALLMASAST
jgi:hypothetical protein